MWAHYSNNHTGFCVGFDSRKLFKYFGGGGPVDYAKHYPEISPIATTEDKMHHQKFTKADYWDYEIEYRLTKMGGANKVIKVRKDTITEIIIGYQMSESDKSDLIKLANLQLPHVKLLEIRPKDNSFDLELIEI